MPPARLATATAAGIMRAFKRHTFTVSAPLCICSLQQQPCGSACGALHVTSAWRCIVKGLHAQGTGASCRERGMRQVMRGSMNR